MRYNAEHKQETRLRVIAAAGRIFRTEGYGGAGIDAMTKDAGVTNGAFYGHFKSKSAAFRAALLTGLEELRHGIAALKTEHPKNWLKNFVGYYLGYKRTCDLKNACALPILSPDVIRADEKTRRAYTTQLHELITEIANGLPVESLAHSETNREERAIILLALLSGGVTLARAVSDPTLAEQIARVIETESAKL